MAIRKLQIQKTERIRSINYWSKRKNKTKKKMKNCENWANKKETQKHTRTQDRLVKPIRPIVGGYLAIKLHNNKNQNHYKKNPSNGDFTIFAWFSIGFDYDVSIFQSDSFLKTNTYSWWERFNLRDNLGWDLFIDCTLQAIPHSYTIVTSKGG